jgi:hypothetical protein
MNRTFCVLLLLAALRLTSAASEEESVPWQSVTVKSAELPVVGIVTIEASTQGGAYQKLTVAAFGRTHALAAADLKRLEGFPLSSLTLTHEAGYAPLGGHTLHLKLNRTHYNEAKKLTEEVIIISVPRDAALTVSEPKPQ